MTHDVRETPEEVISRALSCAEGEAAIDELDERAAREWLAELIAERDAFERDYTAVGERNKELHDMYFAALALAERHEGEIAALRAALTDYRDRIANITSGWGDHLPRDVMYSLSTSHYSVAALLDAALTDSKEVDNG